MGKDYELVRSAAAEDDVKTMKIKIVDEKNPVTELDISCTCDGDEYATCQDCEAKNANSTKISKSEAVLRKRFKSEDNESDLKTSSYDVDRGGWIERDPETTQTFKRKDQVSVDYGTICINIDYYRPPVCSLSAGPVTTLPGLTSSAERRLGSFTSGSCRMNQTIFSILQTIQRFAAVRIAL